MRKKYRKRRNWSDDEKLMNDDLMETKAEDSSEDDADLDEERELKQIMKEQLALRKKQKTED